jgi:hypothetical protein
MKVGELKELLEQVEDDDLPVYIGHQPSWPLCLNVAGVRHPDDDEEPPACSDHPDSYVGHIITEAQADEEQAKGEVCHGEPEEDERKEDDRQAVWLIGGDHPWDRSPYAPRWLWEE